MVKHNKTKEDFTITAESREIRLKTYISSKIVSFSLFLSFYPCLSLFFLHFFLHFFLSSEREQVVLVPMPKPQSNVFVHSGNMFKSCVRMALQRRRKSKTKSAVEQKDVIHEYVRTRNRFTALRKVK